MSVPSVLYTEIPLMTSKRAVNHSPPLLQAIKLLNLLFNLKFQTLGNQYCLAVLCQRSSLQ